MLSIDGSPLPNPFSSDPARPGRAPEQSGSLHGERVLVEDAASVLADAAEELCLYAAEKVEHKALDARQIKAQTPIEVMKLEEIMAYLEAAGEAADPEKLAALCRRMQSGQENPRDVARQQSRDPGRQFVLLQYALQEGLRQGIPAGQLDDLRDALADLEIEAGPQIRSGINTLGAAAAFGAAPAQFAAFQETYRDVVLGEATLAQTLNLLIERLAGRDGEDFSKGLQCLIRALGQDLAAARPSVDANRLQSLVQDLYQLEVTATLIDGCKQLAARLAGKFNCAALPHIALMKELVALTAEKWVSASRFAGLGGKFGVRGVGAEIAFYAASRNLLRDLPVKIYPDADARQAVLNAAQAALDSAIDQEEA